MAFSVEARTPFLDYRLVELWIALPAEQLIHDGWTKAILRESMAGTVPDSVLWRRDKLGFPTPETRWLREIAPWIRDLLLPDGRVTSFVDSRALRRWLSTTDEIVARRPGLFRLLSVELWLRHGERTSPSR